MLIEAYPQSREAKALLSQARRASTQAKKMRRNMAIGGACLTLLAAGALVKVRADHQREGHLTEVRALIDTPDAALTVLNRYFTEDQSPKVLRLRRRIEDSQRAVEEKSKEAWLSQYKAAQTAARTMKPSEALEVLRALPQAPRLMLLTESWPELGDLYEMMGKRLLSELSEQGEVQPHADAQVSMEAQLREQTETLQASLTDRERALKQVQALENTLQAFSVDLDGRISQRATLEEAQRHRINLDRQDELRDLAVKAEEIGDYERALHFYQEILGGDLDPRIRDFILPQVATLESIIEAIEEARSLALSGEHKTALALLEQRIEKREHFEATIMPWKVHSFPTGARVIASTGRTYTTPFDIESTTVENITLTFTSPGFLTQVVEISEPQDLNISLTRAPETSWAARGRVDSVPVPYEDDQIVVDRNGGIARIQQGETVVWSKQIPTLSGVARAPVFFPGGSNKLLLLTEEGSAWLVDATDGNLDGPWELNSPPRVGPLANSSHVHVLLANGQWAAWKDALQPEILTTGSQPYDQASCQSYRYGPNNGMQVLRSREGEVDTLKSRFTGWTAKAEATRIVVSPPKGEGSFAAKLHGEWTYMAWEPATEKYPQGRLWLSDDYGLRALIPRPE